MKAITSILLEAYSFRQWLLSVDSGQAEVWGRRADGENRVGWRIFRVGDHPGAGWHCKQKR